ncbi:DUF7344 domain-containing protein [Halalkalicoccus jeotgali]|uniref:DUF7344 domain-containing protein n=1 Tax=Halalkalicoccus jeotgali TaxID=413810 RepID=UPI0011D1F68D|nr:hypothetical protein [Halalkalicoccus jeotgali]
MTNTTKETELDDVLRTLTPHYRRWTLYLLIEQKEITLDKLVTELCTLGEAVGKDVTEVELLTHLHHVDLPKLVDMGFISYDSESEEIVLVRDHNDLQDLLTTTKKWEHTIIQDKLP